MILDWLLDQGDGAPPDYPGPLHVIERLHRDGMWLPVALGIRALDTADALAKYRSCLPPDVWPRVTFRARLQELDAIGHGVTARMVG
ncbi:MAG: hypothetical protein H0W15_04195 [Gemmatimonadales bacterium]|nr:hypothetical protein [Gemmatimonadales bacterium]